MDKNVTLDLGDNTTRLLEHLAQTLGTTADKLMPYYVRQAYLDGIVTLFFLLLAIVLSGCGFALTLKKAKVTWDGDDYDGVGWFVGATLFGLVFVTVVGMVLAMVPGAITSLMNPEFRAIDLLSEQLGRLK